MLFTVKSFKILPKHKGNGFIFEAFALNWYIFTSLAYLNLLLWLSCRLKQTFFLDSVMLIEYLASALFVASSNHSVGLQSFS